MGAVSWTQPGLSALPETDGHGDTCGPIAMLDYRHIAHGVPLDIPTVDASRTELIGWGLMNQPGLPGMTIDQIATALSAHYQVQPVHVVSWGHADWNTFHTDLIAAMMAHQAVIIEVGAAHNLPDNQPGVDNHFVLAWGIQSDLGFYCCNGDTLRALARGGNPAGPVWYNASDLQAAQVGAYAILPAVDPPAPPPPPPGAILTDNGVTKTVTKVSITYG